MAKIRFEVLKGTLGADPEISYTKDDTTMVKVSIAVNQYFKNDDGEWEQRGETSWINAAAFGYTAEQIEAMELEKGQSVYAAGTMEKTTWEDKEGYEVEGWNFRLDRMFPIPKVFDDEEDSSKGRGSKKRGRRTGKKKGSFHKKKSPLKKKKGSSSSDYTKKIIAQLKG